MMYLVKVQVLLIVKGRISAAVYIKCSCDVILTVYIAICKE